MNYFIRFSFQYVKKKYFIYLQLFTSIFYLQYFQYLSHNTHFLIQNDDGNNRNTQLNHQHFHIDVQKWV